MECSSSGGQEYIGVFNHLPNESYSYPDWYLSEIMGGGMGGVSVSSDGQHLCIIEKGGCIGVYNETVSYTHLTLPTTERV